MECTGQVTVTREGAGWGEWKGNAEGAVWLVSGRHHADSGSMRGERMKGQVHLPLWSPKIVESKGELAGHPHHCGVLRVWVQVLWR